MTVTVDRGVLVRAACALAAYLGAMRLEPPADRETVMARLKAADAMAHPAYAELHALLEPAGDVARPAPLSAEVREFLMEVATRRNVRLYAEDLSDKARALLDAADGLPPNDQPQE